MEAIENIVEANKLLTEASQKLKKDYGLAIKWEIKVEICDVNSYAIFHPEDEEAVKEIIAAKYDDKTRFAKLMEYL